MSGKLPIALLLAASSSVWAQSVISAHSGVIQYVEGRVELDGKAVQQKFAVFPDVKKGQTLAAEDGRAEVLLTPGVFLRIAEDSSFRMVSNALNDTRVELLSGSAIVEVGELLEGNAIALQLQNTEIALAKKGLYRLDAEPARFRVYDGEARLSADGDTLVAKKGREVEIGAVLEAKNFDTKQGDAFYRWAARRDEYVAQANITSAKTARDAGMGYASGSGNMGAGSWSWNPWYGMFTYLPMNGYYNSPFGYAYYSPVTIMNYYQPAYYGGGNSGFSSGNLAGNRGTSLQGAAPAAAASVGGGSSMPSGSIGHTSSMGASASTGSAGVAAARAGHR